MLQVSKLHHLKILNLAQNCLTTVEGLKDLKLLTWLGLSGNRICTIESLSQNIHLEHLDLSDNKITHISDISYLKNLKVNKSNYLKIMSWFVLIPKIKLQVIISFLTTAKLKFLTLYQRPSVLLFRVLPNN